MALGVLAEPFELPRAGDRLPAPRAEQAHRVHGRIAARDEDCRAQERTPPRTVQSVYQDFVPSGLLVEYPLDAALEVWLRWRVFIGRGQPQEDDAVAGE